jgi:annexin A7/11
MGIHAIATGPLAWDVELANKALAGAGTNEALLTELILGRPSAELRLLLAAYRHKYGKDLMDAIRSDLSGKTERRTFPLQSTIDKFLTKAIA